MQYLSLSLAWHYLWSSRKDASIRFMTRICFAGIMIGTFSLMLTLIITNGFEKTICEKLQGINAHITIALPGNRLDYEQIRATLLKEFPDLIAGISGSTLKQVIIHDEDHQTVLFIKGIDPARESTVSCLAKKITRIQQPYTPCATNALEILNQPDHLIIGYKCAQEHGLVVGQQISLLVPEATGKKRIALHKKQVTIGGIFNVGLDEYDSTVALMSFEQSNELFDEEGVDQLRIALHEQTAPSLLSFAWKDLLSTRQGWLWLLKMQDSEQEAVHLLRQRLPHLSINSWKELSPALISSLKLEKYVMFFIIALITLVACMNMISLLFMLIQQKRRDIALFKTIGMPSVMTKRIFLWMGMILTMSATLTGLAFAGLVGYLLEYHSAIPLPDVYYVSHLPARMEPHLFVIVLLCCLLLGFIATWLPARQAQRLNIINVLRQE